MNRFKFWLMEHNPAEFYDTPLYKFYMVIIGVFFKCHECYDGYYYPQYGTAPHWHDINKTGTLIGSTVLYDKKQWPEYYDDVDDGCGMYYCPNKLCVNSKDKQKAKKQEFTDDDTEGQQMIDREIERY